MRPKILSVAIAASVLGCSTISHASIIEEVVVTAQKREQNLQDVGLAVTAFSGDQLAELGYTKTEDIVAQTPGLNVAQLHPTITTLNIRGVSQNDYADGYEAPVAVFVDGAYVSSMGAASAQLFDIQRVEILRGPQGTLFGRNATGGVLHYVSNAPSDEFDFYINGTIGNYGTKRVESAIGGSLSDDIQARLAMVVDRNDGLLKNRIGPNLRDTDARSLKLQVAWQPTDSLDVLLKLQHAKDDANGNGYQHTAAVNGSDGLGFIVPGPDPTGYEDRDGDVHAGDYDDIGFFNREINGSTLKLSYQLAESISLVSISDVNIIKKDYREDGDSGPNPFLSVETRQDQTQYSQEFQLSQEGENQRWQAGIYYLDIENRLSPQFELDFHPLGFAPDYGFAVQNAKNNSVLNTRSVALYGQTEFDLSENLSAILGARYTRDQRQIDYQGFDPFAADGITNLTLDEKIKFNNWSYKAQLDWRLSEDSLLYFGATKTHKAGNFQIRGDAPLGVIPHDQEELLNLEIGFKSDILGGLGRLNAAVFRYDYKDYQAFFTDPLFGATGTTLIQNLDANAYGGEIELAFSPSEGWDVLLGASYLHSTVKDVVFPNGTVKDGELPNAPRFTLNGLVRYAWPVMEGEASVQVDWNHSDNFSFSVLNSPIDQEPAYTLFNARANYKLPGNRWSVSLFINNLSDEEYRLYALDVSAIGLSESIYGPPRMYGVSVEYRM
ncbi:TonB-dependent receptor [Pseudoteredinibacter isoporae]|uniref:Iron complex outermembrane receptor protein n=1 Tax=Pseudoteredinibacter isoporae TaxID=570281 RepID=A0A7X0JQ38_9GAMM|nr:TonB-dependent receptor [Pseudoteredinibacter isoporae]MBB6520228.1 iron complex outermembrane receptor protein [Pseudoteredinibacter isoporae]NHO85800.1 TonB-dependent receptor [Pseudoteredinibacter isoporae]NIB25748.1 TonB-dependent receptor [Pseudoteredinibacter isoporae]